MERFRMNAPTDLIRREIDKAGLPKLALSILEKCDPVIVHYNHARVSVEKIALYEKDYQFLAEKLRDHKQDINDLTYRGYRLVKYSDK
ncbi:hypothetical protein ACFL07_00305 [Pseudomonadota bacterium]